MTCNTSLLTGLAVGALIVSMVAPAHAQMSDGKIRAFIDETTLISNPDNGKSESAVRRYLEQHLADDGVYKGTVTYNIPGYPAQSKQMEVNKNDYIQNVLSGREAIEDYQSSVDVHTANIDRSGKKATVSITTDETGRMMMEDAMVGFEGASTCVQELAMEGNTIVIATATCDSTVNISGE